MAKKDIGDYVSLSNISPALTKSGSPLGDFPFTDSLLYDVQFEASDSQTVQTGGKFRTSRGPNRTELSATNELKQQAGGLYIYANDLISTAYTQGTIFFYDNAGVQSAAIQQPTPGVLTMSAVTANVTGTAAVNITAPAIGLVGNTDVTGYVEATTNVVGDQLVIAGIALVVTDGVTAPATLAGFAKIYVDTADGDLKIKFGDGTVKTIVTDT